MTDDHQPITPGLVRRDSFGATEMQATGGLQDNAMAAAMQAQIFARCTMAMNRPRTWLQVRAAILRECQRAEFAQVAMYSLPRGGNKIEGLSIRFAEVAMRAMTNLHAENSITYDDAAKRMVQVVVSDLESNVTYSQDIVVEKTVERSHAKGNVIGQRQNSQGKPVYIVRATDDEVQQKCAVLISKALRTHILRILPGDIQDDAKAAIYETLSRPTGNQTWGQTVKGLVDAYGNFRIDPVELERYLGHPVDQINAQSLAELRLLYGALKNGEVTWQEVMAERGVEADRPEEDAPKTGASKVKSILAARRAKEVPKAEAPAEQPAEAEGDDPGEFQRAAARITARGQVDVGD